VAAFSAPKIRYLKKTIAMLIISSVVAPEGYAPMGTAHHAGPNP
jgi:hypothetical protein